jgi:Gpi18-like mannosyltransferase
MAKSFFQKITIRNILFAGFLLRLILLPWTYHGDIITTYWWGKFASEFGLRGYFDWLNFGGYNHPDQPMINIYYDLVIRQVYLFIYNILWFLNVNIKLFPSTFMQWYFLHGNQVLLKFPMIVADVFISYFLYIFTKKISTQKNALIIAFVYSFYPPAIYNSALWGSGDSIINLFGLLSLYFMTIKKNLFSVFFILISILYKASLIIWLPILFIIFLKNKPQFKTYLSILIFLIIFIIVVSYPFTPFGRNPLIWFFEIMTVKILPGVMHQITSNAMNFWALIFGLKPRLDEYLLFNFISIRSVSIILCFMFYLPVFINLFRNYNRKTILISIVNISLITFMFLTRMHERYTFPALIPLLILAVIDKRYQKYFLVFSITHILNVYNWWWVPAIPILRSILESDLTIRLISLVNLIFFFKLFFFSLNDKNKT